MADERQSAKNTTGRVLADSANAKHRFGFAGAGNRTLGGTAPKLSDLFFLEFTTVTEGSSQILPDVSVLAKSVSPISIQTSSMPVDQYGKRVYIPTRVDFPEVSLTMYDSIDGKAFDIASQIYGKFFKNQSAEVTGATAEEVITSNNRHGRKLPDAEHEYYHQHFEKVTIYHFFGNLDSANDSGMEQSIAGNTGQGTIQKIELINPLVTGMVFSGSDYSTAELRTLDLTLQPENVILGKPEEGVTFPDWMTQGMNYIMDTLVYEPRTAVYTYPTEQEAREKFAGTEEEIARKEAIIDEANDRDTNFKLNELMQLYNAQIQNPNEQGNEALATALKSRIGTLDAARANKFNKTGNDEFNVRDESTYKSVYLNPDVPTFGGVGSSNPPNTQFVPYSPDLGDAMVQELVSSTFGNRSFNANNVFDLKNQMRGLANEVQSAMTSNLPSNFLTVDGQRVLDAAINANKGAFITSTPAINPATNTDRKVINTGNHTGVSKQIVNRKLFD